MAEVGIRRLANPKVVRALHAAIQKISDQKQCPTFERLLKAVTVDGQKIPRAEVDNQIRLAIRDGLVIEAKTSSNHGKSKGAVQTAFRIVSTAKFAELNKEDNDEHDWYCWECHREGEVVLCSSCSRVYHKKCAQLSVADIQGKFVCPVCKENEESKKQSKKELERFQVMLKFVVTRLKDKADEVWLPVSTEKFPTYPLFIKGDVCLQQLEEKISAKEYHSFQHFRNDVKWLFHNFMTYFEANNPMVAAANRALKDADHELEQITICSDCYMMSNKRPSNWFSVPCKTKHPLCYAKLGTDPPWPAKILQISDDGTSYDVRFFGPPHQRAWISSRNVSSLEWKPVVKKRTKGWIEAEKELTEHLRLLGVMKAKEHKKEPSNQLSAPTPAKKEKPERKARTPARRVLENKPASATPTPTTQKREAAPENNNRNGVVNENYQLIEGLQGTLKELRKAIDNARNDLDEERQKFVEQEKDLSRLRVEKVELSKKAEEDLVIARREAESNKLNYDSDRGRLEQQIKDLESKLEVQSSHFEEQRRSGAQEWEQKLRNADEEFSQRMAMAKQESDLKASTAVDEAVRKVKMEADGLSKQFLLENLHRAQIESERLLCDTVAAAKKKSWCANCFSEAFYHCCWNTNYCTTDCQRVHWVSHRYQCTRDLMNSCRSCQQRQASFPVNAFPHHLTQK